MTMAINNAMLRSQTAQADSKAGVSVNAGSFAAGLHQRTEEANGITAAQRTVSASKAENDPKQMTLEQYKNYIRDKISKIPVNPSQAPNCLSVTISDEGLSAMQKDPEYEKWVLDGLKADFAAYDPWSAVCGKSYGTHFFGATKEDYHGEGWYPEFNGGIGTQLYEQKSADSLWEKPSSVSEDRIGGFIHDGQQVQSFQKEKEEDLWERRLKLHQKNMERMQKDWEKRQLLKAQDLQAILSDPDGEKLPYLKGIPASMLLSMLS